MNRRFSMLVVTIVCAAVICAIGPARAWAKDQASAKLGAKVADFTLQDFRGKAHTLAEHKDAPVIVLAFLGVECPLSKLYAPRLAQLAKDYQDKGVVFLGVDSNRQDSVTEMAQYAKEHGVEFPLLKDLNNTLADTVGAARVPQVFVLDKDRAVRYAGRIDDQYGFDTGSGYAKTKIKNHDLTAAVDELLAGKAVSKPSTDAIGCLIGRVREVQADSDVTYSNQIARLFQERCVECHRPGQIGPFALQTYEEAAGWAEMIDEVVQDGRMPPWHAEAKFKHFKNDISLSADEKEMIAKWVKAGAPEGDPKQLPTPKQYAGSWLMPGKPDAVFHMSEEAVDVPAEGTVDYRYYVVDTGFTEDKWVQVAECLPDNRGVVHHMIVFLKPPGNFGPFGGRLAPPAKKDAKETKTADSDAKPADAKPEPRSGRGVVRGSAAFGQLCGFAPGTRPVVLPPGMAKLIPAGWQLVFQMHYTPNGSPQKDRSSVGIKFADPSTVEYRVATANAMNPFFLIPPGDDNYKVESRRTYGKDVLMLSVFPHMHLRGKDFHYELLYPDGHKETILNMPRYDFNWQTSYVFDEPLKLPKGTTLHCTAHFDNSEDNAANPDATKPVKWGDQTWEEMMIGWFDIAVPKDTDMADVLPPQERLRATPAGENAE